MLNLPRLRKTLRRHLGSGWVRAVFATPNTEGVERTEEDDIEQVVDGPGAGVSPDEAQLQQVVDQAEAAAKSGRVKQTFVLDARRRIKVDARFGRAKEVELDEAKVKKMMGGKQRALRPDHSGELLRVIGIMNADGTISAKHAKKYKQVGHFVDLCRPTWEKVAHARTISEEEPLRLLDLGCGNGYLTFVMAEALRLARIPARIHGVDVRADVIARCQMRAEQLGWDHLAFEQARIEEIDPIARLGGSPDVVLALHACDTATCEALALGIRAGASAMLAAPCCQHELAAQLRSDEGHVPTPALLEHGLLRQDYAALLTDALRVEVLQACGYKVDLVEFVSSEHTPKNLLIRAYRRDDAPGRIDRDALTRVRERAKVLRVVPQLLQLLDQP